MVASRYRARKWNLADDWEPLEEGIKNSPSHISEGYPEDALEGTYIETTQNPMIPLSESLSMTIGESYSILEQADVAEGTCDTKVAALETVAESHLEQENEVQGETRGEDGEREPNEISALVSNLKITENMQDLANTAGSKALEASILVSSFVREGISSGISQMVRQLETLENAVAEQMKDPVVVQTASTKHEPKTMDPTVNCDDLTLVSTMGDTYAEHVKPFLYQNLGGNSKHQRQIVIFDEGILANSISTTTTSKEAACKVQVVQIRKARGRTKKRIVTRRSKSRNNTTARSKSRDKPAAKPKEMVTTVRDKSTLGTINLPAPRPATRSPGMLKPAIKNQLPLSMIKVGGKHRADAVAYMVEGCNSSTTTKMKNTTLSKTRTDTRKKQTARTFLIDHRKPLPMTLIGP